MEFLMPETKVYAILTAGYDRKERMEGRIISGYAEFSYIIGKFDIRRTLDKKSPHKSGHRKQTID